MTTDVTCPTCGTVAQLDDVRDAHAFCRVCDYPLFWIRTSGTAAGEGGLEGDPGLRRLPGTAGITTISTLPCWNCDELNHITGIHCIRCGIELHPAPVAVLPPPPEPEPFVEPEAPPPPPKSPFIPAAWIPALIASILLLALCIGGAILAIVK